MEKDDLGSAFESRVLQVMRFSLSSWGDLSCRRCVGLAPAFVPAAETALVALHEGESAVVLLIC